MISTIHTTHTILVISGMQYMMGNAPFVDVSKAEYLEQGETIIDPCPHEHRDPLGSRCIWSTGRYGVKYGSLQEPQLRIWPFVPLYLVHDGV